MFHEDTAVHIFVLFYCFDQVNCINNNFSKGYVWVCSSSDQFIDKLKYIIFTTEIKSNVNNTNLEIYHVEVFSNTWAELQAQLFHLRYIHFSVLFHLFFSAWAQYTVTLKFINKYTLRMIGFLLNFFIYGLQNLTGTFNFLVHLNLFKLEIEFKLVEILI